MSGESARSAKRATRERIGRLAEHRSALIDGGGTGRGARGLVGALAITSLQQIVRRLPHLHEPEDQGHNDDETAELTGPCASLPNRVFVHRTSSQLPGRRGTGSAWFQDNVQCDAVVCSTTIIMNDPGMTGGRRLGFAAVESVRTGPNFAETTYNRSVVGSTPLLPSPPAVRA